MEHSKARILNGKIAFFMNFGGVLPESTIDAFFPKEADLDNFKAIELPRLKESIKKEKAPYNPVEYALQVVAKGYDVSQFHDVFSREEMGAILDSFFEENIPTKIDSLYNNTPKKKAK